MNDEILQGFLAQAESCLPMIRNGILVCSQTGNIYGELTTSLHQTTAIKDAAEIVCLDDAAQVAEELEKKLKVFAALKIPLTDEQSRRLLDNLAELETIIARVGFDTEDFSIHVNDFLEQSFENLGFSEPNTEAVETADEQTEEFEIDEEMLEIFGEEAEDLIQTISANLKILEKTPNDSEALLEIRRSAHTLKGSAGIVGLKTLSEVAHRVEDLLDYTAENKIEAGERIFEILLAAADCLSTLATGENSEQLTGKINQLYENFDRVTAAFQSKRKAESPAVEASHSDLSAPEQPSSADVSVPDNSAVSMHAENSANNRSIVRVSLEKLDEMVKIMGGLLLSRSVFEQRLAELEQQIGELHNTTRRLQQSTGKIETDFEADLLGTNFRDAATQRPIDTGKVEKLEQYVVAAPRRRGAAAQFDPLELDRYTEFHQTMRDLIETTGDTAAINGELDNLKANLESLFENQRHLIEEMQDKLLRLRMVSFSSLAVRLQRTVRMTAEEEDKSAELIINGENLEVDTQILDSLIEPLLHLLRNAVAHGIESPETRRLLGKPETGRITVSVSDEGTHFILTVADDGRGISIAALKAKAVESGVLSEAAAAALSEQAALALVFLVGLTTAEEISQVSGRGVGMNIVKTAVTRQQGAISIESETHQGTTFTVRLPMRMAVTRALLVKAGERIFAFPLRLVKHISQSSAVGDSWSEVESRKFDSAENIARTATDSAEPDAKIKIPESSFYRLNELLDLPRAAAKSENSSVLLLETSEISCGLIVDEIVKSEEIIIKPLGSPLQSLPELLGATILGDGSVVPVLDLNYLLKQKTSNATIEVSEETTFGGERQSDNELTEANGKLIVLIVDDSPSVRHLTSNIVKNAGWTAIVARDGLEALDVLQQSRELPDVILSDVEMPRMNGYELLASLKKQKNLQSIPVVMITSRANEKHRQKAFDLGVSEYLTKPFDDANLIGAIKTLTV